MIFLNGFGQDRFRTSPYPDIRPGGGRIDRSNGKIGLVRQSDSGDGPAKSRHPRNFFQRRASSRRAGGVLQSSGNRLKQQSQKATPSPCPGPAIDQIEVETTC